MPPRKKKAKDDDESPSESDGAASEFSDFEGESTSSAKKKNAATKKKPRAAVKKTTVGQKRAPAKKASASSKKAKKESLAEVEEMPLAEVAKQKSPAEFFAENQNIAGFDNPGKSLYTTIRELVENALDAAESINVLPEIQLSIEEMTTEEFNKFRGRDTNEVVDSDLFASPSKRGKAKKKKGKGEMQAPPPKAAEQGAPSEADTDGTSAAADASDAGNSSAAAGATAAGKGATPSTKKKRRGDEPMYYRIVCRDNGVGMAHEAIPNMLGRVLSGSKYGVRQTRGKFGLGSKMALIWSKKTTGMPIEITSGHSTDPAAPPAFLSHIVLDIDIYKNEPRVHKQEKLENPDGVRGTTLTVVTGGSWLTYRARVLAYLQQLAIITPYAELTFQFSCTGDPARDLSCVYRRRSRQMPPPALHVKHHPSSVNNLLLRQLLDQAPRASYKLVDFLTGELSCVERSVAKRIVAELGEGWDEKMDAKRLSVPQVHQLTQMLKSVKLFRPPDGDCLSPAGEYNLRLGILKETTPHYVATYTEKAAAFEGHPFVVEAGVAIGGRGLKEGLNVFRFANRIPLLFEGGGDVTTRQAQALNWTQYKIDAKRDKVGVFVSIVSTKIPFKGTGKEYIGDDIEEMKKAVRHALQMCAAQLRTHLAKRNALKEQRQRKKLLTRYVPDVSRALHGVLLALAERREEQDRERGEGRGPGAPMLAPGSLRARTVALLAEGRASEAELARRLTEAVFAHDLEAAQEENAALLGRGKFVRGPLYLAPAAAAAAAAAGGEEGGGEGAAAAEGGGGGWFHHPAFSFTLACEPTPAAIPTSG